MTNKNVISISISTDRLLIKNVLDGWERQCPLRRGLVGCVHFLVVKASLELAGHG